MKKVILTLAIIAGSLGVFASEENVNSQVLNAFKKEFKAASNAQWTEGENFYKVSFEYNAQHITAFYTPEAELIGITRNISSLDLPVSLQTKLRNDYNGYWVADLFEYSTSGSTTYYITMENADGKKVLQSSGGDWVTYKKITKI